MLCLACLLPVRGFFGFVDTPELHPDVLVPFVTLLIVSVVAVVVLFWFAFRPQMLLLEHRGLPACIDYLLVTILIFFEVLVPAFLLSNVVFSKVVTKITGDVLEKRGVTAELKTRLGVDGIPDADFICGSFMQNILSTLVRLLVLVITLPLNDFPVLGTCLWLFINGWLYSWELMADVLPAFGLKDACAQGWFAIQYKAVFGTFGVVALALTLIPVAGPIFFFTNAFAAALLFEELLRAGAGDHASESYARLE
mmetsp:Transcript_76183/g.215562  ORF Transcript_76183/g.215562 Transcript_76183/m.215562 type:complete len:253 (+) Transcript_76183:100-858(+)